MIEINLLPLELRPKRVSPFDFRKFNLIVFAVLGFIFSFHIILFVLFISKNIQYNLLNKKWVSHKKDLEKLEIWKKENQKMNQNYQTAMKIIQQRITIYTKLNSLAKNITDGMWFRHLTIKSKLFQLEGSVVSQESNHMSIFRGFCDNLKQDNEFFKDFLSFEIGPLKTRKISNYEILDFVIEARLK